VDTHADVHVAAALDPVGGLLVTSTAEDRARWPSLARAASEDCHGYAFAG